MNEFTEATFELIKGLLAQANNGSLDMATLTFAGAKQVYDTVVAFNRQREANQQAAQEFYMNAILATTALVGEFKAQQQRLVWQLYAQYTAAGISLDWPPFAHPDEQSLPG
jgi:hypothetical protein